MNANQSAGIGARVSQRTPAQPQPTAEQQQAMDEIKRIRATKTSQSVRSIGSVNIAAAERKGAEMIAAGRAKIIGSQADSGGR